MKGKGTGKNKGKGKGKEAQNEPEQATDGGDLDDVWADYNTAGAASSSSKGRGGKDRAKGKGENKDDSKGKGKKGKEFFDPNLYRKAAKKKYEYEVVVRMMQCLKQEQPKVHAAHLEFSQQ